MNDGKKRQSYYSTNLIGKEVLGRYHIVRKIASGGMGVVYLARYTGAHDFAKPVVVKIILPGYASEEQFLGMFIREAKILASLHHPGIVEVIDFGEEADFYVMVLEYVHGFQLREWAMYRSHIGKFFSIDVVLQMVIDVLEALHHAHTLKTRDGDVRKVIHRDISPSNVMLNSEGRIKLVDFGIARMSNMTGGYNTETGSFRGKLSYAAPERFGKNELTAETDIYSVGVMLHELLTGENEFYTGDHASTIARVLNHNVSSVLIRRPDAPPRLDSIIARALAKDWELRYDSAMEFANDLRKMLVQTESRVREKIAEQVKEDFGKNMAAYLGCQSLEDMEQAWRYPSTFPMTDYTLSNADEETINLAGESTESPSRPRAITDVFRNRYKTTLPPRQQESDFAFSNNVRRGREPGTDAGDVVPATSAEVVFHVKPSVVVATIVGIGIIIGLVAFWILNQSPEEPDQFYLVQGDGSKTESVTRPSNANASMPEPATTGTEGETIDLSAGTSPDAPIPVAGDTKATKDKSSQTRKNKHSSPAASKRLSEEEQLMMLSTVFQKEQRSIERCLTNNEAVLADIDRIFVRFSVNTKGHVIKSSVVPARLKGTPLAACITKIAKATHFPSLEQPLSFAIPIAVTRTKN